MPNDSVNGKVNGDLISREAAITQIRDVFCKGCNNYAGVRCRACEVDGAIDVLDDASAVDAAPVVHGRWIWVRDEENSSVEHLKCSVCMGDGADKNDGYCRHCGAKMDLEG